VRRTYDGPLDLATDYMVWNVTKDEIRDRLLGLHEVDSEGGVFELAPHAHPVVLIWPGVCFSAEAHCHIGAFAGSEASRSPYQIQANHLDWTPTRTLWEVHS
jgi:hypothetical protein